MASAIDSHVHVGSIKGDMYFDPIKTGRFLLNQGISRCVASSTSAADEKHTNAVRELSELMLVPGLGTWPLLWVTPRLMKKHPRLSKPLETLPYRGMKVHSRANQWSDTALNRVLALAVQRELPVLIHTDDDPDSCPMRFDDLISKHPQVQIVLAHGRPLDQAIQLMKRHDNVAVDTAFMPIAHIKRLIREGYSDRILFGSDIPADRCFYSSSPARRYARRIKAVRMSAGPQYFKLIMQDNCIRYFGRRNQD